MTPLAGPAVCEQVAPSKAVNVTQPKGVSPKPHPVPEKASAEGDLRRLGRSRRR